MILVDTTVWIDYFRGKPTPETDWLDDTLGVTRVAICDLILCELLQGTASDVEFAHVLDTMSACDFLETGGRDLAVAAARNYRLLRRHGFTVRKMVDCLIATLCIERNLPLLHNDRDFVPFESVLALEVVHPGR